MFRRAKLMLADVPDADVVRAVVHLTDERGMPRCARLRAAPALEWRLQRQASDEASFALTWASEGLVCAVPSAYTRVGTVWLPPLADITTSRGRRVLLDVDDVVGDALAVQLALQPVAVSAPRGGVHREAWPWSSRLSSPASMLVICRI